jgi:hypothetical protein
MGQLVPLRRGDRVSCKSKGACMDLYGERMGLGGGGRTR